MQELIKTLIKQKDYIIQAFKRKDEVIFRAEPIPEYYPVVFKNLVGGEVYESVLTNLCGDLEVVGIENDLPFDDDSQNIAVATGTSTIRNAFSLAIVENGKITHQIQITTHGEEVKKVSDDLEETAKTSPITPRDRQKILNATKQSDRILEQVAEETEKLINLSA